MSTLLKSGTLLLFPILLIGCAGGGGRPGSEIPPIATTNDPLPQRSGSSQNPQTSGIAASRSEPIIYDYPGATRNLNAPTPAPASAVSTPKPSNTSPANGPRYHTVLNGDTLWGLSKKYSVSVESLRAANALTTDTIKPGQNLKIP